MARNIKTQVGLPPISIIAPTANQAERLIRELCGESGSIECGEIRIEVRPVKPDAPTAQKKAATAG